MKRFWTASAVALAALFAATGCNDYGNTFQGNTGAFLQFVSPSNVAAGGPDLTITLTGNGFVVRTVATWNQKNLKTCVVTTTAANTCAPANDTGTVVSVTATVPAALTTAPGTFFVQTVNPQSGTGLNGLSNPVAFFVFPQPNPVPKVTGISPTSAAAGSAAVSLTITGSNFLPTSDPTGGSQVQWNTTTETNLAVTSITSSQIQATIPQTLLTTAGTATLTVYNAPVKFTCPPGNTCGSGGGGTSNGSTFTINPPGPTAPLAASTAVLEETPSLSADGRYVAFTAQQDGHSQILARDTCQGADSSCQPRTVLISSTLDRVAANDDSHAPSMTSDGRYVAFSSAAANLAANASAGRQVYLRDTCFGVTTSCTPSTQLISTDPKGALVGAESILPSVSASGRFVAFLAVTPTQSTTGTASNNEASAALSSPNSGYRQIFIRDTCLGAANCTPSTTRISLQPGDALGATAKPAGPVISSNAGRVAFSDAKNATVFTRSVAVDDAVFLALTKDKP